MGKNCKKVSNYDLQRENKKFRTTDKNTQSLTKRRPVGLTCFVSVCNCERNCVSICVLICDCRLVE